MSNNHCPLFPLISNDGKTDHILISTNILKKRLDEITQLNNDTVPDRPPIWRSKPPFRRFTNISYEYDRTSESEQNISRND